MGSSVRKTSAKIKKLLKETIEVNPSTNCKEVIPQVADETLRSKKTKNYFADKDFVVLAGGGFACFKKAKELGFDSFIQEYHITIEKLTVVETQRIIESILDTIESENGEIDSSLILSAFQSAMTTMLLEKMTDPVEFLLLFCRTFIAMVIREDINEALTSVFKANSVDEFNENINSFTDDYVKNNFYELIIKCNNGEIIMDELIKKMQDKLVKGKEL